LHNAAVETDDVSFWSESRHPARASKTMLMSHPRHQRAFFIVIQHGSLALLGQRSSAE
jgi:hypothetical protein